MNSAALPQLFFLVEIFSQKMAEMEVPDARCQPQNFILTSGDASTQLHAINF